MGITSRLLQRGSNRVHPVDEFLEPEEEAKWILPAQGGLHPFTMLAFAVVVLGVVVFIDDRSWVQGVALFVVVTLVIAVLSTARYRLIVISPDDVLLLRTRGWRPAKPVELIDRFPRTLKFEVGNQFWSHILIGNEKLWVHKRYHVKLKAADETLGRGTTKKTPSSAYRANRAKKKISNNQKKRY
jgi:hypothetical protein